MTAALERLDGVREVSQASASRYLVKLKPGTFLGPTAVRDALARTPYRLNNVLIKSEVTVAEEAGAFRFTMGDARIWIRSGDNSLKTLRRLVAEGRRTVEVQGAITEKRQEDGTSAYSLVLTGVKVVERKE